MEAVVVLGAGIFGSSVAYHLSLRGASCTVLDRQPAAATTASGKAAGFLASGWGNGKVTEKLHKHSFAMHEELATTLGLRSWRRLPTFKVAAKSLSESTSPPLLGWLDGACEASLLDGDTAQVDPKELCTALLREAQASGYCTLRTEAECIGIRTEPASDGRGRVATGVRLASGEELDCDEIVVAMGPWSCQIEDWLEVPLPIEGVWSTSLVFEAETADAAASDEEVDTVASEPAALFVEEDSRGCHLEVYPRPDGEVYVSGTGGSRLVPPEDLRAGKLPPAATDDPDPMRAAAAAESLASVASTFTPGRRGSRMQACVRPCAPDGLPVLGPLPQVKNVYVATGGNVWGILWSPAAGRAVADMILADRDDEDTASTSGDLNLRAFAPKRFDSLTYRTLLKQRGRNKAGEQVGEQW